MRIIVTGASRGIGYGIARVLGRAGHQIGAVARDRSALKRLKTEIEGEDGRCCTRSIDLRDAGLAATGLSALIEELKGVDALINNAGRVLLKGITDIRVEEWHDLVDTNLHTVFHATWTVLPHLRRQRAGHIINISSVSGRVPLANGCGYAATKYAVVALSEVLRSELARLESVCPCSARPSSKRDSTSRFAIGRLARRVRTKSQT